MAPDISYTKTTLDYPIFAADFDPYNRGYLVVGGGGGEGRSGVPNRVTILDLSNRAAIETAAEIDLSRDEDSVQCLANLATKDGLITYAGINSSRAEQDAGKNAHFRSFEIKYPPRKKQKTVTEGASEEDKGEVKLIGQTSLFRPSKPKDEQYQRLLRLSPAKRTGGGSKRIGAVATGLAKESQIVVFNATEALPRKSDIITKIDLPEKAEAADLDVIETEEGNFSLVYCTDYEIFEQTIEYDFKKNKAKLIPKGPRRVHQMPFPDAFADPKNRSKFRCIRFLDAENIVTLANRPGKQGADLQVFHLYPTGPGNHLEHLKKKLPSRVKAAVSLDICPLDADVRTRDRQIAVAVAGQDISIEVYVLNYIAKTSSFSGIRPFTTLREIGHPQQMTKLLFSPFHSPPRKTADSPPDAKHPGPQYLRLASVSYGNTVVVDTFPLTPLEPKRADSRYVLSHPSQERKDKLIFAILAFVVTIVTATLAQNYLYPDQKPLANQLLDRVLTPQIRSHLDPIAARFGVGRGIVDGAQDLSSSASAAVSAATAVPSSFASGGRLRRLLQYHHTHPDRGTQALVVKGTEERNGVDIDVHPDREAYLREDVEAKPWHELSDDAKAVWRDRLVAAGEWIESEGESVLKGILFSEYAGLVAQAVR